MPISKQTQPHTTGPYTDPVDQQEAHLRLTLAFLLADALTARHMTQMALAATSQMAPSRVSSIMGALENVTLHTVSRMAVASGIRVTLTIPMQADHK